MWWLFVTTALAGPAQLLEGTPEFQDTCLANEGCTDRFTRFLSESMSEQSFTMQPRDTLADPGLSSAGVVAGVRLDTFPFGPPATNLSGKEENTSFSPVLPRFGGGLVRDVGDHRVGFGGWFLPPVPVGGASALSLGLSGGVALGVGNSLRVTPSLDLGYTRARAPVVASEEQFEDRDSFSNPDNLRPETYEAACGDDGCLDTFTTASATPRVTASIQAGPVRPFLGLGLGLVQERLYVQYDDTLWGMGLVQPVVNGGAALEAGHFMAQLDASAAYRPAAISEDQAGAFFKLGLGLGWRFGG